MYNRALAAALMGMCPPHFNYYRQDIGRFDANPGGA
jgi:hypothetical protein